MLVEPGVVLKYSTYKNLGSMAAQKEDYTTAMRHYLEVGQHTTCTCQGTHCTGKTGKMGGKNPCKGKHRQFGNFAKTQGIWFTQVVSSLILKSKDISIIAAKISNFLFEAGYVCQVSFQVIGHRENLCWTGKTQGI